MTTYYTVSGNPVVQTRGSSKQIRDEFTLIQTAFANVDTILAKKDGPTFTGTVVLPATTSIGNVSATELSYLDGVTSAIQTQLNAKAPSAGATLTTATLVSPTLSGTPIAPTATAGTNTTQIATTEFVTTAALTSVVPVSAPDSGKYLTNNGTAASWSHVFASGTVMLFAQTAAPTGWTKSVAHNDKALRVVSGTASSGGSTAFTTVFASRTPAGTITGGATTLTESQIPAHYHFNGASSFGTGSFSPGGSSALTSSSPGVTSSAGGGGSHTHTDTFSGTAMDFAVQYVDVILATKD